MTRTLVFGGARSGKSAYAERLASASGKPVIYLATAQPNDAEMQSRIAHHRTQRPAEWLTLEQPLSLADTIEQYSTPDNLILIDCLTLWLSNLLFSEHIEMPEIGNITPPAMFAEQRDLFLQALTSCRGDLVMVSNEVGMGIVPQGAISRWFVDEAGRLNQAVAAQCEQVAWVAAGLPLYLKSVV
ncbi:bifunctional adenosylcobinamide kinase/adenosylcobinamide-phosphate guanylyltransferase [Undibacterium sp. Jales W-56]|uniref:bifunctional adenosylcobinamide kinase/adenosylcobinamide-phosphate guanylyltransferase n=1 Tax=Undibacterium sp. Jales W-56 TaxID=2897325 RepID=UPI0021D2F51E|nr:bifunctional adenosylcobinamide kinase/adenosylcobinamide-phosphate guanylyltransferase [Undibacterium sp. Jales W-56]MCU6433023.1 bifunctional adenosylcobinamide kinase/adenosylcobinamide-phosphate guanylyltransferase [Undibacterium sp. Jales W-56]